ncbi:acyltransferase family protein [Brevibacterium sp. LE-L]|uniref:acyltransferase family protein n=1 Tax=Brevibacterium sp. LE-L TaxID=3418557 RepID=UPI003CE7CA2C
MSDLRTDSAHLDASPAASTRFQHLEGLRGFSIALVVIFHVFIGRVSSGVDVFLFLGGTLLLSSQIRNAERLDGRSFARSVLRVLLRLLPALLAVVATTVGGVLIFYPHLDWGQWLTDASAAASFWINWRFVSLGSDYDAAGIDSSPLQHLWSMSVQFQIYIAIIALVFASRGRSARVRMRPLVWIIALLSMLSLLCATWMALAGDQGVNYYSTFSRFWEIGAGALLGLVLFDAERIRGSSWPRWLSAVLSWVGVVMIFSVGLFFDGAEQFPGPLTLVPLLGALLLIGAGLVRQRKPPIIIRVLESAPLTRLGTIAYSLYLWHWPLLILTVRVTGIDAKNPLVGVPVILASLLLAELTHRWVEIPLRQRTGPEPLPSTIARARVGMVAVLVLLLVSPPAWAVGLVANRAYVEHKISAVIAEGRPDSYPGAGEILDGIEPRLDVPIMPGLASRDPMMPPTEADRCTTPQSDDSIIFDKADGDPCWYGDTDSERSLYVVGGSHSEQWLGALDIIGKRRGIRIVPFTRAGCPLYYSPTDDTDCISWSRKVEEHIRLHPPSEGIFMSSTRPTGDQEEEPDYVPDEYIDVFERLAEEENTIFAVRDTPWLQLGDGEHVDPRVCVGEDPSRRSCTVPAESVLAETNPAADVFDTDSFIHLDLSESLIQDGHVQPVIGNVLVFRDWNHLTHQYVRTLAAEVERQMFSDAAGS